MRDARVGRGHRRSAEARRAISAGDSAGDRFAASQCTDRVEFAPQAAPRLRGNLSRPHTREPHVDQPPHLSGHFGRCLATPGVWRGAGIGRGRRRDRRRRRGRHCGSAPHRRRQAEICARRSDRPHRRALHHRHDDLRRAVRSRRALDSHAGHQSGGAACDRATGIDIYGAPPGQKVRIGRRYAREGEMEDYLAAMVRAKRAIDDAARKSDGSCAQALPKDLGDWQRTIEFTLGPFRLRQGSRRSVKSRFCADPPSATSMRSAASALAPCWASLAKISRCSSQRLSRASTGAARYGVEVETARGKLTARAVIVTVSNAMLTIGKDQVHAGSAAPPARRRGETVARQLRSHRA